MALGLRNSYCVLSPVNNIIDCNVTVMLCSTLFAGKAVMNASELIHINSTQLARAKGANLQTLAKTNCYSHYVII